MKKIILSVFAVIFPFVTFLILDLPGAALMALGLQSTILGWPIAVIWAFKEVSKVTEQDKLRAAAAAAAAAAEAATKAKVEAEAKVRAEAQMHTEAEAKIRAETEERIRAEVEAKIRAEEEAKART